MLDFTHLKGNSCQTQGKYLVGLLQLARLLWLPTGGLEYSLGVWRSQELFLLSWPRAIEQWWWIWGRVPCFPEQLQVLGSLLCDKRCRANCFADTSKLESKNLRQRAGEEAALVLCRLDIKYSQSICCWNYSLCNILLIYAMLYKFHILIVG